MSRGQKLVAMVLASKKVDSKKDEASTSDRLLPCSSKQADAMSVKSKFGTFESESSYIDGFKNDKLAQRKEHEQSLVPTGTDIGFDFDEDDVAYDDSDVDPNYVPSDEEDLSEMSIESSVSLNVIASQIEANLEETSTQNEMSIESNVGLNTIASHLEANLKETAPQKSNRRTITKKRNLGQEYFTQTGKLVSRRSVKPLATKCKKKCSEKVTCNDQEIIFNEYWNLGSYNLRQAFLSGMIQILPKKTETKIKTLHGQRNRIHSYNYFVEVKSARIQVCQKCFLGIFGETEQFIKTIIKKKITSGGIVISSDKRGQKVPPNKISDGQRNLVLEHINSFPCYESHYTRRHSEKKYLQPDLNMSIMYKLYSEKYDKPVSITKYTEIFKSLNLKFKKPQLDVCNKCELLEMQIKSSEIEEDKLKLTVEKTKHLEQADYAYVSKREDQQDAKVNQKLKTFTFDLQQCLPTPYFRTSISFYKRQLWTFNLTIHDAQQNGAYNMMWHEAEGHRGGNEIASCLYEHLLNLPPEVSHVVLYSDSCAGQNKNSFLAAMFQVLIQTLPNLEFIDHKFLVPGHTHMECDTVHALIEKKKKKTTATIHHPRDWYNFIRSVNSKYHVTEITRNNIYNFSSLVKEKFTWRKNNTEGERFLWQEVKWMRYTRKLGDIQYKTTLCRESNFKILNIQRRGISSVSHTDLKLCYDSAVKISEKKKQDLLDMLPLISQEFHNFYTNLETDALPDDDPDLLDESEYEN